MIRPPEELYELKQNLFKMREEGLTTSQIATRLGMTRNQVSGLISRLVRGYKSTRKKRNKPDGERVQPGIFLYPTSGARPRPSQPVSVEGLPIISTDLSFDPPPGKVSVWNIRAAQCRWIDDEGYFCATPTGSPSKSYCAHHERVCFRPLEMGKKKNGATVSTINS